MRRVRRELQAFEIGRAVLLGSMPTTCTSGTAMMDAVLMLCVVGAVVLALAVDLAALWGFVARRWR
jgi:hypothetical protein